MSDLGRFIEDPEHTAPFTGTYLGNLFESRGLAAPVLERAIFNFMAPGAGAPRLMVHEHTLRSGDLVFTMHGTKSLEGDPLETHAAADFRTLFSTLTDATGAVAAAGVLHFPMPLFLDLLTSFKASGDESCLVAKLQFLKLFLRKETYVLLTGFRETPVPTDVRRKLARARSARGDSYDVVVIGSGYDGGATAARLSRETPGKTKRTVCVLERGRELVAGDFPTEPWQLVSELRTPLTPRALIEFVDAGDIETVVGNSLGRRADGDVGAIVEVPRDRNQRRGPLSLRAGFGEGSLERGQDSGLLIQRGAKMDVRQMDEPRSAHARGLHDAFATKQPSPCPITSTSGSRSNARMAPSTTPKIASLRL